MSVLTTHEGETNECLHARKRWSTNYLHTAAVDTVSNVTLNVIATTRKQNCAICAKPRLP